jgi:hypothetical protein
MLRATLQLSILLDRLHARSVLGGRFFEGVIAAQGRYPPSLPAETERQRGLPAQPALESYWFGLRRPDQLPSDENAIGVLQGPGPIELCALTQNWHEPAGSAVVGVTEQVPPSEQPRADALMSCRTNGTEAWFTQRK